MSHDNNNDPELTDEEVEQIKADPFLTVEDVVEMRDNS